MLNRKTLISLSVHANAKVFLGTSKQKQLTKQLLVLWSRLFAYYISKICFKFKSCQYFLFGSSEFIVSIGGKKWNCMQSIYAINEIQSIKEKILFELINTKVMIICVNDDYFTKSIHINLTKWAFLFLFECFLTLAIIRVTKLWNTFISHSKFILMPSKQRNHVDNKIEHVRVKDRIKRLH